MNTKQSQVGVLDLGIAERRQDRKLREQGYLTFAGWAARDRGVLKGQKARLRNSSGTPLFHESQTAEFPQIFASGDLFDWDGHEDHPFNESHWGQT